MSFYPKSGEIFPSLAERIAAKNPPRPFQCSVHKSVLSYRQNVIFAACGMKPALKSHHVMKGVLVNPHE